MKMIRYSRLILAVTSMVLATTFLCMLTRSPTEDNSLAYFKKYYGADEEIIHAVAHAYQINPDKISDYGPEPFPVNYIKHKLGWDWRQREHPVIQRSEIDSLVKGYISKCETDNAATLYLFYSDWLSPRTREHGEALVLEISYRLDTDIEGICDEQIVSNINTVIISDSGGWYWDRIAPMCEPAAKYEDCSMRLPVLGCIHW